MKHICGTENNGMWAWIVDILNKKLFQNLSSQTMAIRNIVSMVTIVEILSSAIAGHSLLSTQSTPAGAAHGVE